MQFKRLLNSTAGAHLRAFVGRTAHSVLALAFLCIGLGTSAQVVVTIAVNPGTTGNGPMGSSNYHVSEHIFLASEIAQDFTINGLRFNMTTLSGTPAVNSYGNVNLYLRYTASTTFAAGAYSTVGYTPVYSGPMSWTAVGFAGVNLTTPFAYAQASGNLQLLVVRTDNVAHSGPVFAASIGNTTSSSFSTCRRYNSTVAPVDGTTSLAVTTFRTSIQLVPPPCVGTPAPGNTLASANPSCPDAPLTLSLQNPTAGAGVTYAWGVSTTGVGGTYNPLGGSTPTLLVAPGVQSWYRCTVTCSGGGSNISTPVQVNMNSTSLNPQPFALGVINDGCWVSSGVGLAYAAQSAYGIGAGSARWNFYNTGTNVQQTLTSPYFPAVPADWRVKFDVAGQFYDALSVDTIKLEEFNGTSWVLLQTMTNNVGDFLNTAGTSVNPGFIPGAGQWASRNFILTPGTSRIRFRGISGFGQNVHLDNIIVEAIPSCLAVSGLTAGITTATSATIMWNAVLGAVNYNVEVRQGGTPGTAGAIFTGTTAGTSLVVNSGLVFGQSYEVYVQTNCNPNPLSSWAGPVTLLMDYCATDATVGANNATISAFSVAGISNTGNTSLVGYQNFTSLVGNMVPGGTYPFSVTRAQAFTNDTIMIWIDWNQDYDFNDPGERVFGSTITSPLNPTTGNITVPPGALTGNTRMRVRRANQTPGFQYSSACGTAPFGQVHDYTISLCAAPVASVTISDNCVGGSMDAVVNISSIGSGVSATITYQVNAGTPVNVAGVVGANSLTALGMVATPTDRVTISVGNGTICGLALGTYYSNCPVTLDCNAPAVPHTYCYKNNDTRTFHYIAAPGQTISLNFIQGSLDLADAVNFYDASNNLCCALGGGNFSGDLSTADFNTTGTDLYFEIITGASNTNSCFDGGQSTPWQWTVQCTPDCQPPSGIVDYVLPISCNPPGFYLDVTAFTAGAADAAGAVPNTEWNILWTINGGSPGSLTVGDTALFAPVRVGPFPLGSNVSVTLGNAANSLCNAPMGSFTQANTCPPANDNCANAQVLTINPIGGCPGSAVQGTTRFATPDPSPAVTCNNAGTIQDVWYTFNTGTVANPIQVRFTAGTAVGYAAQFYASAAGPAPSCLGASLGCIASAAGGVNLNLTANTNYYIRVFTNTVTGTAGTFGICLAGSSCPAPTLPTATLITDNSANIGWTGPIGNYIVEYGPIVSFTTPGTGATAGTGGTVVTATAPPVTLSGLASNTSYRFFVRRNCGAGVFSFNTNPTLFNTLSPPPPPVNISHGTCAQAAAIPDAGCTSNTTLRAQFPITTVGTMLGVDVTLQSVDLIIAHTYRSDLQISLISPTGQVRSLINARGDDGVDLGNSLACPTGYMRLVAGGALLSTLAGAPAVATGNWAPEQSFNGLTGNPNGTWTVRICDAFGGDVGTLDYVRLNFAPCGGPTFNATAIANCAQSQYSISINISDMGNATSYAITNTVNASAVTATGIGSWVVGPFTSGVPVTVNLGHNVNATCNATTGSISFSCPPANDLCANAIPIACNTVITGYTTNSVATGAPASCGGFASQAVGGVWYTVQGWNGPMTASLCSGTNYDSQIGIFTGTCGAFTCVAGNDDFCGTQSQVTWTGTAGTLYTIYVTGWAPATGNFSLLVQCGTGSATCTENGLNLVFQTDANPGQTTWEILNAAGNLLVRSGGPLVSPSGFQTESACLPNGCYRLRVLDSASDGILGGGYILQTQVSGKRIIDNRNNFSSGMTSAISGGQTFCLPIGVDEMIYSSCDKLDWVQYKYMVAHANSAVSATWVVGGSNAVQPANSGYEFWIYDPNGTYSFRRFRSHNVSDGFSPATATRAAHMKIHSWFNTPLTPHIPNNVLMNVRVRGRVNGNNLEFGPACRMKMDVARAACPLIGLQDDPAFPQAYSCGVSRTFGGNNTDANKIEANPPQFAPSPLAGGTGVRFQFRFRNAERCIVLPPRASPRLYLNWPTSVAQPLMASETYDVDVRVSKDLGATWCTGLGTSDAASNCSDNQPWGLVCSVTISSVTLNGGSSSMATQGNGAFSMYPNPNRGDQVLLSLSQVASSVNMVTVDIYDMTGKRVMARSIPVQDGRMNTSMDLNGDLAGGLYLVNVTAGDKTYTERLAIQP